MYVVLVYDISIKDKGTKRWSNVKGKELKRTAKSGKRSEYVDSGIVVNDEVREHFEDALNNYKKGRNKSFRSAFDWMNCKYYSETKIVNGVTTVGLMPESQRPTYNQFYHHCKCINISDLPCHE